LPIFLLVYVQDLFVIELITKVKPNNNSIEVHPQLSNNGHLVDGALVGVGSLWPIGSLCYFLTARVN
jgi:hypothetical protein